MEILSDVIRTPLRSPLDREIIVVQSRGMERWVSMELARHHGVCANVYFPFPNRFIHDIFSLLLPSMPKASPFDRPATTWGIMKLLPELMKQSGFEALAYYLSDGDEGRKQYELADRIADTFDQYLLFRPEMVLGWEKGKDTHWQATLWRALVHEYGAHHRAAYGEALLKGLRQGSISPKGLPQRVTLFGISALPRFHLAVLEGISPWVDVYLYLLNPCQEYWGHILSDQEMARIKHRSEATSTNGEILHLEGGNRLLATMGALGREFFELVQGFDPEETTSFMDPGDETLLARIQRDILYLDAKGQASEIHEGMEGQDDSLQIHSCHSPMREMEVLYDAVLAMFERDPDLAPRDILVMAPDIETYVPFIQAVFETSHEDPKSIPFNIADRRMTDENEIVDPFLSILGLCESRLGAEEVVELLQSPLLRSRFGLTEEDLDLVRAWVRESSIRWGMNGGHREEEGLPLEEEHTWKSGLDRLLLGYAMSGRPTRLFEGILPQEGIEGDGANVIGRFLEYLERVFYYVNQFKSSKSLSAWERSLSELLEDFFFVKGRSERDIQTIRAELQSLSEMERISGFHRRLSLRVIRQNLSGSFEKQGYGYGFMAGGVTFCAMLPMRSIPFKVVCLLGLNHNTYPRKTRSVSFDLMTESPRLGDRSRTKDDRYLFLEALLGARKTFYVSYVGQNIRDNSVLPSSVLVTELLEYVENRFKLQAGDMRGPIIRQHRLHGFSPEYYRGEETLFSYSQQNYLAARASLSPRIPPEPLFRGGLSEPNASWQTVEVEDLCQFYSNPAKWLLRKRLGIFLEEDTPVLEETEPFDLKGLERYKIAQEILAGKIEGKQEDDLFTEFRAAGRLPHGVVGECLFSELSREVEGFAERLKPYFAQDLLEPLVVDLPLGAFRVNGSVGPIYSDYLIMYRYARLRAKDFFRAWIHHGALNTGGPETYPKKTLLIGLQPKGYKSIAWRFDPVEDGEKILKGLMTFYWTGLTLPLPFFTETSWTYGTERIQKGRPIEEGMKKARRIWEGGEFMKGERDSNPYYRLCFKDMDPLGDEFRRVTETIMESLIGSLIKEGR
jgi:exodeoxyribonuclease V gamma subunit